MDQKNLKTTLFTLNGDSFLIMLLLQFASQYLRNIFRPRSIHLSKAAINKRYLSMNLSIISMKLIHLIYLTLFHSKPLLTLWKVYRLDIWRLSISPNILKAGGIWIAIEILKSIDLQSILKIGDNSGIQSRKQNKCSLT